MTIKAVELIVSGEVQEVGYRNFVARIARRLNLVGSAENLKTGAVRIRCKGGTAIVDKFKKLINVKTPVNAPLIEVEKIVETRLKESEVMEESFEELYGDKDMELLQAVSTGTRYIGHLSGKIDNLSAETKSGFDNLGNKMDKGFSGLGNKIDQKFDNLDGKYGKISTILEKINKNIEKTASKKGIF